MFQEILDEPCELESGQTGICRTVSNCPFYSIASEEGQNSNSGCPIESQICCQEILENNDETFKKFAQDGLEKLKQRSASLLDEIPDLDTLNEIENTIKDLKSGVFDEKEEDKDEFSPFGLHKAFNRPRKSAIKVDQAARHFEKAKIEIEVG